jgi:hypothetical protein
MRLAPSNWKGFVTTPTVRTPSSRAACAMIGAAPVPVPPPMPAVMKAHVRAGEVIDDLLDRFLGGAAPTAGRAPCAEPLGHARTHLDAAMRLGLRSACASVFATTNSQPSRLWEIMLLTALPPAPPTPNTVMRGLRSCPCWGMVRLSVIALSACCPGCPVLSKNDPDLRAGVVCSASVIGETLMIPCTLVTRKIRVIPEIWGGKPPTPLRFAGRR